MGIINTIENRKSKRAFLNKYVEKEIVEKIIKFATRAPSAINLQPWEFIVVAGEEKERLSRILLKAYHEKQISCSPDTSKKLPEKFYAQQKKTFEIMNPYIKEMGYDFNKFINEGSCNFYGAPIAVIVTIDRAFSKSHYISIGAMLGYFVLIAHEFRLGTCPIGLISAYQNEIKEFLDISDEKDVVLGIALGYPDNSPINKIKTPRCNLEEIVRWVY